MSKDHERSVLSVIRRPDRSPTPYDTADQVHQFLVHFSLCQGFPQDEVEEWAFMLNVDRKKLNKLSVEARIAAYGSLGRHIYKHVQDFRIVSHLISFMVWHGSRHLQKYQEQ